MAKKNEVATAGQFSMNDVPDLLAKVEQSISDLKAKFGGDSDDTPANGNLEGIGDLSTIDDIPTLVRAHSSVMGRMNAYKASAKTLGVTLTKHPFRINNASAQKWEKFIIRRIGEVTYAADLAKLTATKEKLSKYVSKEQQLNSDMKDIMEMIGE